MSEIEVCSEWGRRTIADYILDSLPYILGIALIISIIYFIDGILKYGYWLYDKKEK